MLQLHRPFIERFEQPALPLTRRAALRSGDLHETQRNLSASMPSHRMFVKDLSSPIRGYINKAALSGIGFSVTGIGAPVVVEAVLSKDVFLLHVPLSGHIEAIIDGFGVADASSKGFLLSPDSRTELHMSPHAIGLQVQSRRPPCAASATCCWTGRAVAA